MSRILEAEAVDSFGECLGYQSLVWKHAPFVDKPFVSQVLRRCCRMHTLLDVGTGPGLIPTLICKARPDITAYGVDLSRNMLSLANAEAAEHGLAGRIFFEEADAKSLPYESESFDAVISHSMLHHVPNPVRVLNEMARVLKPGSTLLVKDILRPPEWAIPLYVSCFGELFGYSAGEKGIYAESLQAALTVEEIRRLLEQSLLHGARVRRSFITHFIIEYTKAA